MPDFRAFHDKKLVLIVLFLLGCIIYSNTLQDSFHLDDIAFILNNPAITALGNPLELFKYWPSRFIGFLTFAVNYRVHRFDLFGYHLVNIVAHIFTAFLVYWFALLTFSASVIKKDTIYRHKELISFFAAALFLAHPVQTEAVNYIFQRVTILAAFFYLGSLCLYAKALLPLGKNGGINKVYFSLSLIVSVICMSAKENAVTLPAMILIYDFYFLRVKRSINWKYVLPFFILFPLVPLAVWMAKPIVFTDVSRLLADPLAAPSGYLFTQFKVLITYLRLFLFPAGQNFDYDYPLAQSFWEIPVLGSFIILVSILFLGIRVFSRFRLVSFGILWFFITLLPESSVIPLLDPIFEHRLYLPLAGCSIFAASAIYYLFRDRKNNIILLLLTLIVTLCSVLTYSRNRIWENEVSLWSDVINKSPNKIRPYNERGLAYLDNGEYDFAIADFSRAVKINPNFADGFYNRGSAFQAKKEFNKAILDYNEAVRIAPDYIKAYVNRGMVYYLNKEYEKAVFNFKRAIEINPFDKMAYLHLAYLYSNLGRKEQAIGLYKKILMINPKDAAVYNNLASEYYSLGQFDLAVEYCDKAIQLGYKVKPSFRELISRHRK